ncbi:MAG: heavy metal translocating P-type ATPase metal-binding domain-containing protein [Nitrospirota bacterium]
MKLRNKNKADFSGLTEKRNCKLRCDLCQLEIEGKPFVLHTKEGDRYFCCKGCIGVYEILHWNELSK